MFKRQKEVLLYQLSMEDIILDKLERQYERALNDINEKIKLYQADLTPSRIRHIQYQEMLKGQVEATLDKLHADEYRTIQQYLDDSYTDAFVGVMYDLHGQNMPIVAPIDRKAALKAILTDTKLTSPLYKRLGLDLDAIKETISQEITRGIVSGMMYPDIARNISNISGTPLSSAKAIARTEGHRIQQASAEDARQAAKAAGGDVVKQWDATMDGVTRDDHRLLDGQIREVDEPFEINGKKAMYPGDFGDPAQDCNCRCVALTRARKALDADELATLKDRAAFFGLDKTKDFETFKEKYLKTTETLKNQGKSGIIKPEKDDFIVSWKQFGKKIGRHAADYGYDPSSEADRQKMLSIIYDIKNNPTQQRVGYWRGQSEEVIFYIKGEDVVIVKQTGEFVTIMKGGIANERVKNARKREV